ncbi:MAG: aminotransferase class I/II-fold pyridoxal phosphate-dependent enzyme [Candidatus Helarchaeota archaeon]
MNELAYKLNETIKRDNEKIYELLSELGKELYFPRGILFQGAEAKKKAHKFNATIGIATEKGAPMHFKEVLSYFNNIEPNNIFNYAPASGRIKLRTLWKQKMIEDNPSLKDKKISLPIVTNAITHGLSICADLFVDKGSKIILPDKIWGNYKLIFGLRRGAEFIQYQFFDDERFNINGFKDTIKSIKEDKIIIIFNFPNNPIGYSITENEGNEIVSILLELADAGKKILIINDDAYFGLFYSPEILKESLFAYLSDAHQNILAVKLDGVTKEEFLWGFRVGFITFGAKNLTEESYKAFEEKTMGIIRGTISNCSMPTQSIVEKMLERGTFRKEQKEKFSILEKRYRKVKEILRNKKYLDIWDPYPFNSGYFLCLKLKSLDAEKFRKTLLDKYGIGIIATAKNEVRIAFSCIEENSIEPLFETLYKCALELLEH